MNARQIPLYGRDGLVGYALVDEADYDEISQHRWNRHQIKRSTYAVRSERRDGRQVSLHMHRQILNPPKGVQVDHINRNGLDNRRENLRLATNALNRQNLRLRSNNTSGYRGVSWYSNTGKWHADLKVGETRVRLGGFATAEDANEAVVAARKRLMPYATD